MLTEIADENLTYRVAAMMVAKEEVQSDPPGQLQSGVHAVLQTYTVPLAQVRKELKD